jgi:DNA-binding beta-propeller fold protein YncE
MVIGALALPVTTAAATTTPHQHAAASGTQLWAARVAGRPHADAGAAGFAAAASPDGSAVFVTGDSTTNNNGNNHGITLAYNAATGVPLWRTAYLPKSKFSSRFLDLKVSPDGSTVFVAGEFYTGPPIDTHFVAAAYNATTGALLWSQRTATMDAASSIAVSPDGATVFVTTNGRVNTPGETVAYNAQTGTVLWSQSAGIGDGAVSAAVSPDGSAVFVTGVASTGTPETVAYTASTGTPLWTEPAGITPLALAVSPDGSRVFISGEGSDGTGTQAYNAATGATLWTVSTPETGPDALAVSPDGSTVFVTGFANGKHSLSKFYGTQAYDAASGDTLWTARYRAATRSPAVANAYSAVVSPDGSKVFITGAMPGPNAPGGYGTVAYAATSGTMLWADVYHGHLNGGAQSVAVTPDGAEVFVTGSLYTGTPVSWPYLATVAYSS